MPVSHPREILVDGPTPLQHLPRLSDRLGIELFVKRDDLAGPSIGGNKSRQLEFYLGEAMAQKADTLLITGAVQSNFVRLAASVARSRGLQPIVQLEERVASDATAYRRSGNVLLCEMLGAEVMTYPEGEDENGADAALHARADALRAKGHKPYIIHLSEGHPPLGALGYVEAAREILTQRDDFDVFVVGSGSGATHSGLLAGLRGEGITSRVIGGCVRRASDIQCARIAGIIERLGPLYDGAKAVQEADIEANDAAFAPGYGQIGPLALRAMRLMAECEGLILDPVYTAKVFGALLASLDDGAIEPGARVCFIHTGGLAGLFAYQEQLAAAMEAEDINRV